jgi:hypothetical protein
LQAKSATLGDSIVKFDPALEAANRFPQQSGLADILENVLKSGGGLGSIQRLYTQRKTDPI